MYCAIKYPITNAINGKIMKNNALYNNNLF